MKKAKLEMRMKAPKKVGMIFLKITKYQKPNIKGNVSQDMKHKPVKEIFEEKVTNQIKLMTKAKGLIELPTEMIQKLKNP